jgi:hypothetical protein
MHKDVGHLQIPMHNPLLAQVEQPPIDGPDVRFCITFAHNFVRTQDGLEVAAVTQLSDDITVSVASEHLVTAEDVGVVETFEDVDLGV